jgi:hypothetical protein
MTNVCADLVGSISRHFKQNAEQSHWGVQKALV